jgi:hypothetical protein
MTDGTRDAAAEYLKESAQAQPTALLMGHQYVEDSTTLVKLFSRCVVAEG